MNILVPDSWLREYLTTKASVKEIAKDLTLCSQSVERIHKKNGDSVYEIEITTNRPDCLSVYGIARELAAILPQFGISAKLKPIKEDEFVFPKIKKSLPLKVEIKNKKLCPRFTALIFDQIKIKSSPKIVQERLEKAGIRALNNVVDISNYLMLELGQPMHTFDYDKIKGTKMILREAAGGEKLTTLDGQDRAVPDGAIIIEDGDGRIIDLCGIMGGLNSAVDANTQRVLLFVQTYDPMKIRRTCQKLAFRTEAAARFEKGVDPEGVTVGIKKAINMFEKNCSARIASGLIDIYPNPPLSKNVFLSQEKLNQIMGINIGLKAAVKILQTLGFTTQLENNNQQLTAGVPHWRSADVSIPEDLIEEVARIYGYHNLPVHLPPGEIPQTPTNPIFASEDRIKDLLKDLGFNEAVNYSLVESKTGDNLQIANPLTDDWVYMRTSLIPSVLHSINQNQALSDKLNLFEMANVYIPQGKNILPEEIPMLTVASTEKTFFELKGIVELILSELRIEHYQFRPYSLQKTLYGQLFTTGKVAEVLVKDVPLGVIGETKPGVMAFDLDLRELLHLTQSKPRFTPISKFPPTFEDLSFVVLKDTPVGNLIRLIKPLSPLIQKVELINSYQDTRTLRITYQSLTKTLTDKEIAAIRARIITRVEKEFKAKLKGLPK
jgi:phenylalanyl-tRNA synthetase beta chain